MRLLSNPSLVECTYYGRINPNGDKLSFFIMKKYSDYFSDSEIAAFLFRKRVKLAKKRSRKHSLLNLTNDPTYNYHRTIGLNPDDKLLSQVLPPRRSWAKPGKVRRYTDGYPIDSSKRSIVALQLTFLRANKSSSVEPWYANLLEYAKDIRNKIYALRMNLGSPNTIPQPKDQVKKGECQICRPISLYGITDSLLISQTNKYLISLFDSVMSKYSYAFRLGKRDENGKLMPVRHHDAFARIIEYRKHYQGIPLYVAECDMEKFFDSVSHPVVKIQLAKFVLRLLLRKGQVPNPFALRVFAKYLCSYSFNKDVLPLNENQTFFRKNGISQGKFKWVEKGLERYYTNAQMHRVEIGIPQGGAISGLIANMVLDYVDRKIGRIDDGRLLYLRYCDDMIIMHPDREFCKKAVGTYYAALQKLKLVPHEPREVDPTKQKCFWESKSKAPYCWSKDSFNWITFVGCVFR